MLFAIATVPVFMLLVYIYFQDTGHREPLGFLSVVFLAGCLSVVPAIAMETWLSQYEFASGVANAVYTGFAVAGFSEELCKFLLLLLIVWRSRHFDEYFDGIVYAAYLGLGFACVENVNYVFTFGPGAGVMRALLAVPAHFLFAVTMGYFLSMAKFDPKHRGWNLCRALVFPVLLHGTYDSLLMVSEAVSGYSTLIQGGLMVLFVIFDIRMWRWGIRRIKKLQELSQQQNFDPRDPFAGFRWDV
ncbi:MAG: PrsW family intramembrane metalloprotease [Bacteroidales bacterium]|nr:PrsW family intramembrane metalloprotease [Bacteroidales bacterium]